ncbi:DUF4129 domain-containing protein [Natronoglomus mannanivorans]|uniref:Protein-glutamine gamma-glutamyltransferase-like C-terminal domain-containing protein n=1 Tax=Natronoglomus mannanivorans TaxID=2979990 RepID=A0AAP2YZB1_9EURY|nr:hypothetical protein [Halobacteria archaeon AArc-xg1-1]
MNPSAGDVVVLVTMLGWVLIAATGGSIAASTAEQAAFDDGNVDVDVDVDDPNPAFAVQADPDETNTSDRHLNPDEYRESGNLGELETQLTSWLVEQLREGAAELAEGEHETAHERVDEQYEERLEQYVEIASETAGEHHGGAFEAAGTEQARLTTAVSEYETAKADYDAALENGDQRYAHDLARELDTLAGEIENASLRLHEQYDDLEAGTEVDLSAADTAIEAVVDDVRTDQREIRDVQFVETELTIASEAGSDQISFRDPLETSGTLRTVDGEPIANETIRFEIGPQNETVHTETAADGSFDLTYRPTAVPLSTTELVVRYVPEPGSPHLETETSVDVTVSAVEPTVTIRERPDEVALGDEMTVSGTLAVGDVPVDGVSLVVTLDDQPLETVDVSNGSFEESMLVPVSVESGEQDLAVSLSFDDQNRALSETAAVEPTTVLETESELLMRATRTDNETVLVEGWLGLAVGESEGVADQPVEIHLENATAETVWTGEDGTFESSVAIPHSADGGDRRVRASYAGTDANLAPARAETTAPATDTAGVTPGSVIQSIPFWAWIGAGLLVTVAIVLGGRRYRQSDADADSPFSGRDGEGVTTGGEPEQPSLESPPSSSSSAPSASASASASTAPSPAHIRARLEEATDHLSDGAPDATVECCYEAVRWDLETRIDHESEGSQTHWEFYRRYRDHPVSDLEELDTLRTITDAYERAVFDRRGNTTSDAERVLEHARHVCSVEIEDSDRDQLAAE